MIRNTHNDAGAIDVADVVLSNRLDALRAGTGQHQAVRLCARATALTFSTAWSWVSPDDNGGSAEAERDH